MAKKAKNPAPAAPAPLPPVIRFVRDPEAALETVTRMSAAIQATAKFMCDKTLNSATPVTLAHHSVKLDQFPEYFTDFLCGGALVQIRLSWRHGKASVYPIQTQVNVTTTICTNSLDKAQEYMDALTVALAYAKDLETAVKSYQVEHCTTAEEQKATISVQKA